MSKRKVKFKIFKISNLITDTEKNNTIYNYYNHRIVDFILLNILSHKKKDRKKTYNYKTETVYLLNYNPYFNSEYSHGQIVTIRHGKEQRNVDVEDLSLVGLIKTNQGIEYKIDFFINKQKGYIFVEQDENYVLTISKLRSLLRLFKAEVRQYVKYLNTLEDDYLIESKPIIDIEIIKPLDIKEQIKLLTSVKSVSLFEKDQTQDRDIEDIDFDNENGDNNFFKLASETISEYDIGEYDTILKLTKFRNKRFAGDLERFINYVIESERFGGYSIEGTDAYGVNRVFTPDMLTRDIQFEDEADSNGIVNINKKIDFIRNYLSDNSENMPETAIRTEPDYKNIKEFLTKFSKFKGDYIEVEKKKRKNSVNSLLTLFRNHKSVLKDYRHYKKLLCITILLSIIISLILNCSSDNIYNSVADFNKLILPYYSISIGFTITSATFLINSMTKEKYIDIDKETNNEQLTKRKLTVLKSKYIRVMSLVTFYVLYSLTLLIILFMQILIGKYIIINQKISLLVNIPLVCVQFFLIFYSFVIFFLIVYSVYLFSITYINQTIEQAGNEFKK